MLRLEWLARLCGIGVLSGSNRLHRLLLSPRVGRAMEALAMIGMEDGKPVLLRWASQSEPSDSTTNEPLWIQSKATTSNDTINRRSKLIRTQDVRRHEPNGQGRVVAEAVATC
eukprot:2981295-Amphidinium_carterae.1